MVNKITPDKRPALAFDDADEVGIIQIALRTYKNNMTNLYTNTTVNGGTDFVNKINGMLDELDKVMLMFNKKEK